MIYQTHTQSVLMNKLIKALIKKYWKCSRRRRFRWASCWSGRSLPPAPWSARCSRGMNLWSRCNTSARCILPPSPCVASCTCRAFWTRRETSETWGCRWWGWWRCWCRCTSGRRGGTRCCGTAGRWRSWPPPGFGKASRARRRGRPPQLASLLSVDSEKEEQRN